MQYGVRLLSLGCYGFGELSFLLTLLARLFWPSLRLADSNDLSYLINLSSGFRHGVLREIWQDVPGQHVYNLTSSSKYQENPTIKDILNHFDANKNIGDNYGQRLTTFYRVSFKLSNPEGVGWSVEVCLPAQFLKWEGVGTDNFPAWHHNQGSNTRLVTCHFLINQPLILARLYCYFTSRGENSQDSHDAITPACVDICPPIVSVEEKHTQRKSFNCPLLSF